MKALQKVRDPGMTTFLGVAGHSEPEVLKRTLPIARQALYFRTWNLGA